LQVNTLFPENRPEIVVVESVEALKDGFKKLIDHRILSAPLYDTRTRK